MSLFASEETVRLYIKDDEIVDEETDTWVEVLKELPISVAKKLTTLENATVVLNEQGVAEVKLTSLDTLPDYTVLATVIKNWSEPVPVNPQNIARMKHSLLRNLWAKLAEMYKLGGTGGGAEA